MMYLIVLYFIYKTNLKLRDDNITNLKNILFRISKIIDNMSIIILMKNDY